MEKNILLDKRNILAIDEAGRGALAGPLAVGGVYLTKSKIKKLEKEEIIFFDSKILTPQERLFFLKLIKNFRIKYKVIMINNKIIDKKGINNAFVMAIKKLINLFKPQALIIDGLSLAEKPIKNSYFFVKGDQKLSSLAAASIVAKAYRDKFLEKISSQYPEYQLHKNKGYGTNYHCQAIINFGPSKIHRFSFLRSLPNHSSPPLDKGK